MAEQSLTYSGAGVDITKGNQAVELMKHLVKSTSLRKVDFTRGFISSTA